MERKAWPYLAGLIDSDGSLGLTTHVARGQKFVGVYIVVTNSDKRLMKWLVQNFGGTYYSRKNSSGFSTGNDIYTWAVLGRSHQESVLTGLFPFLILKKRQAELILEMLRLPNHRDSGSGSQKEILHQRCKQLNKDYDFVPDIFSRWEKKQIGAYAAGYIDGDGSILGAVPQAPSLSVTSVRFASIKWFLAHFGGKFYTIAPRFREGAKNIRTSYTWRLSGNRNKQLFLLQILPYLILKKDQARLTLEALRLAATNLNGRNIPVRDKIALLNQKVSALNRHSATTDTPSTS